VPHIFIPRQNTIKKRPRVRKKRKRHTRTFTLPRNKK
jgi:hypothetical protein